MATRGTGWRHTTRREKGCNEDGRGVQWSISANIAAGGVAFVQRGVVSEERVRAANRLKWAHVPKHARVRYHLARRIAGLAVGTSIIV